MDENAPDLVMRLYWDCQKLQERLNQLPYEEDARKGAIHTFLIQMEAKYPDAVPDFQLDMSWFMWWQTFWQENLHSVFTQT